MIFTRDSVDGVEIAKRLIADIRSELRLLKVMSAVTIAIQAAILLRSYDF